MMLIVEFVVLLSCSHMFPADVGLCCYGEGSAASVRMLHHVCMEQGDAERDASSFSDWLLSLQFSLSSADSCTPLQQWVACCNLAV